MGDDLTLPELARRVGEPPERLREWTSLRLVGRDGRDAFDATDIERIRVIQLLLRRGITIEAIARANDEETLLDRHVELAFPDGVGPMFALDTAAARLGVDVETLCRLCQASGLLDQGELLSEMDLTALAAMKTTLDAGFPEEAVVQLARVYLDALGRVAEAESRFTHFYLHDRMRAQGMSGTDLSAAMRSSGERLLPLVEPMVLYFHRKGWVRALREDAVMHVQERMGLRDDVELPGQVHMTIAFVDLAGFTSLADAMGDHMAAQVIDRFSRIVRESTARWEGRVVKQIGDAFMLVFHEPRSAVECTLAIERQTAAEPQFPATRIGIHSGQVLYREGDYLGSNVNVAARLAAEATRHQILVTAAVRTAASGLSAVKFLPLGPRRLRGLAHDVEVFEVSAAMETQAARLVDPVCGMELGEGEEAARLSLENEERAFCSQQCLQRFVAAPERYGSRPRGV
jgi:class 3 adenylate cyclase/YHS domain-containing protein/DNA-binding transcriptional MerR regulator